MNGLSMLLFASLLVLSCNRPVHDDEKSSRAASQPVPASSQHELLTATSPAREGSIYDLEVVLTDQAARDIQVDVFRGQPVIMSMFYASCPYACPTLISDIKRLEKQLDAKTRARVRVLLVTFDPERDTPERLRALAALHGVDESRWRLARSSPDQVRELAAVLGLKYRRLENGEFNHSSVITVLDGGGVIRGRIEGLEQPLDLLSKSLGQLVD